MMKHSNSLAESHVLINNISLRSAMLRIVFSIIIILYNIGLANAQKLVINEVMSANVSTISDRDGEFPDWIEIYNADMIRVSLHNFGLSDDESDPFKWIFPNISIAPDNFLLVFASGKDIKIIPIHWETVIEWGDEWKYFVPQSEPPSDWRTVGFDDSDWLSGPSGFGYGDNDDSTNVGSQDPFEPSPVSIFIRKKFTISNVNDVVGALLHVDYDDGFIAYLNNVEIIRENLGFMGTIPDFDQFADTDHEAQMYKGGEPEKFIVENIQTILVPGENVVTMQVHNTQLYSSDLTLIPFFTLEMIAVPPNARGPSPHLTFPASTKLHTNFKINATGETLLLTDVSGKTIDKVETGYLWPDISFGCQPDGTSNRFFFKQATPATGNIMPGYQAFTDAPQFSYRGGFYTNKFLLELSGNSSNTSIHYTYDGSVPSDSSSVYHAPILIDSTTVVRARIFGENLLPGKTVTHTYFLNQQFTIPVISLSTDPANFWDNETGIYVFGENADTMNYPYWGSNFWEDWERPIHIEFFEPDGQPGFSIDGGVKIFGSWSRLFPQKALAIFARGRYGYERMEYQIFPDKEINEFKSIVLRNSGQDWGRTFFRDAMCQSLVKNTDIDIQAYRPAMVFLNGKIFGIHNIREKMNEHYLAYNRGVDPDNIDFLERDTMIITGDTKHYQNLLNYVATHDMSVPSNYAYIKTQMDVENFIDYTLSVLYFANPDWPWNNVKCWRPKTADGKWKWLLFDLDYCFHGGHLGPDANTFNEMRNQTTGTTFLFFTLLENEEHKHKFINRFADYLNTIFEPSHVIGIINEFKNGIEPAMPYHIEKWSHSFEGPWWLGKSIDSMEEWYSHIQVPINFAEQRVNYVRQHIIEEFYLMDNGIGTVKLNISPAEGGRIKINSSIIETYPWSGQYFEEIPIQLTALPNKGFRFNGWSGAAADDSASIRFNISDSQSIIVAFVPDSTTHGTIVINEINYRSASNFDTGDWVEFFNNSSSSLNMSGWVFKDCEDIHGYIFPSNTILKAEGFLVLCRNKSDFERYFTGVNSVGDFNFGLSGNGELIRLYDREGNLVDSLTYDENSPWPEAANGAGYSLELSDPDLENSAAQSWAASTIIGGTPGAVNSVITSVNSPKDQLPKSHILYQNYPNPFNSQTVIQFALPQFERVSLKIFNLLGEEIKVLIDNKLSPARYSVSWDGTDVNGNKVCSGIYFSLFKTDSYQQIKKMILIQ